MKMKDHAVLALFVLVIFGFSAANLLLPDKNFSEMENRYLARRPVLSWSALLDSTETGFAQRYETYFSDQFPLRDGWISLKAAGEVLLGKTENNGVVFGADHYLFEKFRSYDTERLGRNVGLLAEFAAMYPDMPVYAMLVPSADAVLSEKVPAGLGNVEQIAEVRRIEARLREAGVVTVDVSGALQNAAAERPGTQLYYRTDHHWTAFGAQLGAEAFLLAREPDASAVYFDYPKREQEGFYGTHFSKAKRFTIEPDTLEWYDLPVDRVTVDGEQVNGLYDLSKLETRDKYAMFLWGNPGVVVIENDSAPGGTLLVIKDSFANSCVPLLTGEYSRIVTVDLRALPQELSALIAREGVDETLILYSFRNLTSDANLVRIRY